jgi:hypothetical protein
MVSSSMNKERLGMQLQEQFKRKVTVDSLAGMQSKKDGSATVSDLISIKRTMKSSSRMAVEQKTVNRIKSSLHSRRRT